MRQLILKGEGVEPTAKSFCDGSLSLSANEMRRTETGVKALILSGVEASKRWGGSFRKERRTFG